MLLSDWSRAAGARRSERALPIKTVPWTSSRGLLIANVKLDKKNILKILNTRTDRDTLIYIMFFPMWLKMMVKYAFLIQMTTLKAEFILTQ